MPWRISTSMNGSGEVPCPGRGPFGHPARVRLHVRRTYGDGFTAFLINGLFIAGTVTGIHNETTPCLHRRGIGIPSILATSTGSANAAKKWNLEVKREVLRKVHASLAPLI